MIEVGDRVIFIGHRSVLPFYARRIPDSRLHKPAIVVAKGALHRYGDNDYYVLMWEDIKANSSYHRETFIYRNGKIDYARGLVVRSPYLAKTTNISPVYVKLLLRR